MKCLVLSDATFGVGDDGHFYASRSSLGSRFWARYLCAFEGVTVLAPVGRIDGPVPPESRVDWGGIEVLPAGRNRLSSLASTPRLTRRWLLSNRGALFVRSPCLSGDLAALLAPQGFPTASEVVGHPLHVASALESTSAPKAAVIRMASRLTRLQVARSASVAYVSRRALEPCYPAKRAANVAEFSSVILGDEWFSKPMATVRVTRFKGGLPQMITVGSLSQPYKGVGDLLQALHWLRTSGTTARLVVVGNGRLRKDYETQACRLGLSGLVTFTGALTHDELRQQLDCSDLFVLASWTEGLPGALIEAMARGLPAVATNVGGVGDILPPEFTPPARQPIQLARAIQTMLASRDVRVQASRRNAAVSQDFRATRLAERRCDFYAKHRDLVKHYWDSRPL